MNAVIERQKLAKLDAQLSAQQHEVEPIGRSISRSRMNDHGRESAGRPGRRSHQRSVRDVVEISVGADDGVRKGNRGSLRAVSSRHASTGKYIGMIEVIQADYGNRAVCRPDKAIAKRSDPERVTMSKRTPNPTKSAAQAAPRNIANRRPTSTRSCSLSRWRYIILATVALWMTMKDYNYRSRAARIPYGIGRRRERRIEVA